MLRLKLLLATAAVAAAVVGLQQLGLDLGLSTRELVGSHVLSRPTLTVTSMPAELALRESGSVTVRAEAPAKPGDRVELDTAGPHGLGFNEVSEAFLDENLRATLTITGRDFIGSYRYWARIPASSTYQEGRSKKYVVRIVAAGPPAAPTCGGKAPRKADGSAWVCTYDDEFDGTELDRRYWVPQVTRTSGFTTGTRRQYACAEDRPDTIGVRGGNLELSLVELPQRRRCGHGKSSRFVFGQVMHFQRFAQTYGRYEVRARVPDVGVPGLQQSFWLWPKKNSYGSWPASGEIDFAELYSHTPDVVRPYIHYLPGETARGTNKNVTHARCPIDIGRFNTYGLEWQPGRITVLVNGRVCFVNEYSSIARAGQGQYSPFDKPFFLSLNQAMGDLGNLYDPALVPDRVTTQVDYVRIWK